MTSFSSGSRQREVSHKVPPDLDRVTLGLRAGCDGAIGYI